MKRRFSRSDGSDSLELLLDTLCNVFGGIVLIACLLAIVPRATMPPPLMPVEFATTEMTERRISSARVELQHLEAEMDQLPQVSDPARAAIQSRRDSLLRTLEAQKTQIKETEDGEILEANARAIVAQTDPGDLNERLDHLEHQVVGAENLSRAGAEKIRFLEERLKLLGEESETLAKSKVQAVRFPRERAKNSSPFPIIAQYGQLYPLVIGNPSKDNMAIHRVASADGDGFRAEPMRGRGIALPESRAALLATLKAASAAGHYVSVYLYPDSHEIFQDLKNALSDAKISYGLEFIDSGRHLGFSSNGSAPPEL